MVRLKSRYLLIDILYPDPKTWPTTNPSKPPNPQLAIHAPTSDTLTPGFLAKMVRETVSELYGDWGVGKLGGASAGGLNSMLHTHIYTHTSPDTMLYCYLRPVANKPLSFE
jgi:ribonuclease P/MRP protein subunit POP5